MRAIPTAMQWATIPSASGVGGDRLIPGEPELLPHRDLCAVERKDTNAVRKIWMQLILVLQSYFHVLAHVEALIVIQAHRTPFALSDSHSFELV
jgi:hypothetical protein